MKYYDIIIKDTKRKPNVSVGIITFFTFLIIAGIVRISWIWMIDKLNTAISTPTISFIAVLFFVLFLFALLFIIPFFYLSLMNKRAVRRATLNYNVQFSSGIDHDSVRKDFFETLAKGRKTIATIVSIQYINARADACERNIKTNLYAVHQSPAFKVEYKFNPPDDSDPNDLIHSITVREVPETFLKVGDPLPILYRIHKDGMLEHVYSIPFPMILSDVEQFSDVLGHSERRMEQIMDISRNEENGDVITYTF